MSADSDPCWPIFRPAYDDTDFRETVDMITHILAIYLEKEPCTEKEDAAVIVLFQSLRKNSENISRHVSVFYETWMQAPTSPFNFEPEIVLNNLSIDVCVDVLSGFEFEDRFMEVLLEEREFELIEGIRESLMRWACPERSAIFARKCLDVLLDTCEISVKKVLELQSLFLFSFGLILEKLPCNKHCNVLKRIKEIYIRKILRTLSLTKHLDIESFQLLKSAFELVENETITFFNANHGSDKVNILKKGMTKSLQNITLMQRRRKTETLEFLCRDNSKVAGMDKFTHERLEILIAGVLFIENVAKKLRCKDDAENPKEMDFDALWIQIVHTLTAEKSEGFSKVNSALLNLHSLQMVLRCHTFLELLDGWDNCSSDVVHKLPNFTKIATPLTCSVEFLTNMFTQLASFYTEAVLDQEKQEPYDFLLSIVFEVANNAEIGVIRAVMVSCLDAFSLGKLTFFDNRWCREKFIKELNLVINQLSENELGNFHDLAALSLLLPFDTLHELFRRGCSSAPLAKLVLKFLDQMSPLLLLQQEGSQQREIIIILIHNFQRIKKDKFQTVADFVDGIMKIRNITDVGTAVSPYDIISHVLIPSLDSHKAMLSNAVPLPLLLSVLQSVLERIDDDVTKRNSTEMIDMILRSSFCMIQILSKYHERDFVEFLLKQNERQQLHVVICNTLKKVRLHSLGQSAQVSISEMIQNEFLDMDWQYRFYFVDLFYDASYYIKFPIPSQILHLSANYGSMQFYGIKVLHLTQDPCHLWNLVFKISEINEAIAQHFADSILRTSKSRTLDIITAVSKSLVESTNNGWRSVVSLIRALCQVDSCGLFSDLGFDGLESKSRMEKQFTYEKSIITHSFLIILKTFSLENEDVLFIAKQKIEGNFVDSLLELKESEKSSTVNCLVILFRFASLLQKIFQNGEHAIASLVLQILEAINKKELIKAKPSENRKWSQRLVDYKRYIANIK